MSKSRLLVAGVFLSAVACGGTARVEGSGPEGGAGAGAGSPGAPSAGAWPVEPGVAGAPNRAGAPNMAAGAPSVAGEQGVGGDGSCVLGGQTYPNGASWACDCNTCYCKQGSVSSTLAACTSCRSGGNVYYAGQTFSAPDGCNTCTCAASGAIGCTQLECACDAGASGPLHYLFTGSNACAAADYECPVNTEPFSNACGCGCAQAADCPPSINCLPGPPPSDCSSLKQKCPYSPVAL